MITPRADAQIIDFDYHQCKDNCGNCIAKEDWDPIHNLFSEPHYLWAIQPVATVQQRLTAISTRFEIHFATTRLPKARRTTIEWLESHKFPPHFIHFVRHRQKHTSLGGLHAAIEDDYDQAKLFAEQGIPCYLLQHPWNLGKPAVENVIRVEDWPQLVGKLMQNGN